MIRNKYLIYSTDDYQRFFADDVKVLNDGTFQVKNVKYFKQNFEKVRNPILKSSVWNYKKLDKQQRLIYDFEVYPNYVLLGTYDINTKETKQYELSETKNDFWKLSWDFLYGVKLLIGHNNKHYDEIILNYIISEYMPLFKLFYKYDDVPSYNHDKERWITNEVLLENINTLSDQIISKEQYVGNIFDEDNEDLTYLRYKYFGYFLNMDLMSITQVGVKSISLKKAAVNLQLPKIQELPIKPGTILNDEQKELIKTYNVKDLTDTYAEYLYLRGELPNFGNRTDIQIRERLYNSSKQANYLSASKSKIAQYIFEDLYLKKTGLKKSDVKELRTWRHKTELKYIINPKIKFTTIQFQKLLSDMKNITYVYGDEKCVDFSLDYDNLTYDVKSGGIHSSGLPKDLIRDQIEGKKKQNVYLSDNEWVIVDVDVASQYPRAILNYGISPYHLNKNAFLEVVDYIVSTRLVSKKLQYDKTLTQKERDEHNGIADSFKITANTIYGLFSASHFWLYDPQCTLQTTLNNQLFMLMLIENLTVRLKDKCLCIYANTDGCSFKLRREVYNEFVKICNSWEHYTNFELEYVEIDAWYLKNVNNYILKTKDGKIKAKGEFDAKSNYDGLSGINVGYSNPIIKKAVENKLFYDADINDTILSCDKLFDFADMQTVSRDFDVFFHTYSVVEQREKVIPLQQLNRYIISNDPTKSGYLIKHKGGKQIKIQQRPVVIINDYYDDWKKVIDYDYYIAQANRLYNDLKFKARKSQAVKYKQTFNQMSLF